MKKITDISDVEAGLLTGLGAPYSSIFLVDIPSRTFKLLKTPKEMGELAKFLSNNYDESVPRFIHAFANPEYVDALTEYMNLDTVDERMGDKPKINSLQYRSLILEREWVQIGWKPGLRDKDGHLTSAFVTIGDIDAVRKRQAEEIKKFNEVIDSSNMGVWQMDFWDGQLPLMYASPKMKELLGLERDVDYSPVDLYRFWYSRVPESELPAIREMSQQMMRGQHGEVTYSFNHPNKGLRYVRGGGTGHVVEGKGYSTLGYFYDVTEQELAERAYTQKLKQARKEAEEANAAKTSFLFNMSHDIRTPMNAIIGFTHVLDKYQDDPVRRMDCLKKIENSSSVLLSIINNVLEMARIEKGSVELDEVVWHAEQLNDSISSIVSNMMRQKEITFVPIVDIQHPYVYCDSTKIREVFFNILSNACKYTPNNGYVEMRLTELPSNRAGYAVFQTKVTDTGIGMSEDFIPHIFEEFSRENNTTHNKIEGTGLGMSIVKRLVELMGGTIEVQSRKGEGSTFTVTLSHRIAEKPMMNKLGGIEVDPHLFVGKRILLVEDNDLNAEIAIEILGEAGFVVERASDGLECVEMLESSDDGYYNVILMDVQMPRMNGYEATRTIRSLENINKAHTPILAMTANAFEEDKREALRAGMNGHLTKPIDITELMKGLSRCIS